MKKPTAILLSAILMLTLGTTSALAAGKGPGYTDSNNDGVCDYSACVYIDEDGNGVCDNCSVSHNGNQYGRNYVDADGNGVCDNRSTEAQPKNNSGRGHGHGHRHERGCH